MMYDVVCVAGWPGIPPSEEEKKAARAKRFGLPVAETKTGEKKVGGLTVDNDEEERRKKRAERFGIPTAEAEVRHPTLVAAASCLTNKDCQPL